MNRILRASIFLLNLPQLYSAIIFDHFTAHPKEFPLIIDAGLEITNQKSKQLSHQTFSEDFKDITFSGICSFSCSFNKHYEAPWKTIPETKPFKLVDYVLKVFSKTVSSILNPKTSWSSLQERFSEFLPETSNYDAKKDLDLGFSCCKIAQQDFSLYCYNGGAILAIDPHYTFLKSEKGEKPCSRSFTRKSEKQAVTLALLSPETVKWYEVAFNNQNEIDSLDEFIFAHIKSSYDAKKIMYELFNSIKQTIVTPRDASLYLIFNEPSPVSQAQ